VTASFAVAGSGTPLVLAGGRVSVTVDWQSQYSGQAGHAVPIPQQDGFGFFYFTDSGNPEVFVKVLDFGQGGALCFVGGLTDFPYTVTFTTLRTGQTLVFDKLASLERKIRRQNTRVAGALTREYEVVDVAFRFRTDTPIPMQLVVDGARNRKAPDQRDGFWAALVLGSLRDNRFRGEYTYAKMDKDVTVAAYAGDDFFWGTGWLGHRAEIAFAQSPKSTFHVIGQMQQFKDSPNLAERTNWLKRLRLEARRTF